MKTINDVREAFWDAHPEFLSERRYRKRQNDYSTDVRVSFVDFVDHLSKEGTITEALADRVTL